MQVFKKVDNLLQQKDYVVNNKIIIIAMVDHMTKITQQWKMDRSY
ncbi:unnamed protein product [Paramecium sonneborni]|uniref:Uncharacterized protein n=1 Tax=Paramecium sonneborni TaxID=65129 RepID=A0A8S1RVN6_9CILI|nr:unnamed protein product [Paramecium sonneborni]